MYVTHDQMEAFALADRIAVMQNGRIVQIGTPEQIYAHPVSASVADFLGVSNIFRCRPTVGSPRSVTLADHDFDLLVDTPTPQGTGRAGVCLRPKLSW